MKFLRDIRIEIERWNFRRKAKKAVDYDHERMGDAVIKAKLTSEKINKRLWVIKLAPGDYVIYTKQQVRAFFNRLQLRVNYMQTNEYIVHITNKPD